MALESAYVPRLQMVAKEEYLKAKRLHNGRPMNSEGRTLSIFKANFKSIKTKQIHQIDENEFRKFDMNCFQRADQ